MVVVVDGRPLSAYGEEALEYKDLSKAREHDDDRKGCRPPRDVEVERLGHETTLSLVLTIDRLILHYLCTEMSHR